MQLVWLTVIVGVAAFLQTSIGFGFAIFSMVLLPLVYPYGEAIALMKAIGLVNTVYLSTKYRHSIEWRTMLPLLIPTLILGISFTYVSLSLDTRLLRIGLGCLLILLSVYFLRYASTLSIKPTPINGVAMGLISGVSNGLFGIGGPPAAMYLLPAIGEKIAYMATIQAYFTLCNVTNLAVRVANGALDSSHAGAILVGWVSAAAGTAAGLWAFKRLNLLHLKRIVYGFIGLNGVWIIIQELVQQ